MTLKRREFLGLVGAGVGCLAAATVGAQPAQAAVGVEGAATHPAMLYDTTKCVGCHACQNACREWNATPDERGADGRYDAPDDLSGSTWTLIQLYTDKTVEQPTADRANWSFVKRNCMHCIDPACVSACTVGALQKSPEGPVIYDVERCFGCRYCLVACPYHVPRYQWGTTTPLVQKCTFCSGYVQRDGGTDAKNRLAQGNGPACVEACPTGALTWGTREAVLQDAHTRIEAEPGKYYEDRVYGEFEAGGTLQLVLSHVPFTKIGLPVLDRTPLPTLTTAVNWAVPIAFIGVGGLASLIYRVRSRAEQAEEVQP